MPRRRPAVFWPGYWHPAAAGRQTSKLLNGPVSWRPPIIPIQAYTRPVTGIPLVGGQGTAVMSGPGGGGGLGSAPVQSASNTATSGTAVTVTLGSATTAHNCLIVYVGTSQGTTNPTVSGITLGGVADHFAVGKAVNNNADSDCEIWTDQNCAGGQTAVVVTFTGGSGTSPGMAVIVEEWPGVVTSGAVDQVNGANGSSSTSWSSGATGTLSQASELITGAVSVAGTATITGPASPWVNTSQVTAGTAVGLMAGHQVVSSTGAQTYSGTFSVSSVSGAVIATLRGAAGAPATTPGLAKISVGPQGLGNVWYPAQATVSTTSGVNDNSTCQIFLGPAGIPITLVATIFPGGVGTAALAVPSMTPGQYLIAQWTGGNAGDVASLNVIGTMDSIMPG